jgi:hypothetical protein
MYEILKKPDVNVTNAKDKDTMLPVIQKTNERVIEGFKNGFQKLQSPQSPPSGSAPASRSQPKSGKQYKTIQVAPSDSNAVTALNDQ